MAGRPQALFMVGLPGSGKSTSIPFILENLMLMNGPVDTHDLDQIIKDKFGGDYNKSKDAYIRIFRTNMDLSSSQKKNIVRDGTGRNYHTYESEIKKLITLGYKITIGIVYNTPENAHANMVQRNRVVRGWYKWYQDLRKVISQYFTLSGEFPGIVQIAIVDNSPGKQMPKLLYFSSGNDIFCRNSMKKELNDMMDPENVPPMMRVNPSTGRQIAPVTCDRWTYDWMDTMTDAEYPAYEWLNKFKVVDPHSQPHDGHQELILEVPPGYSSGQNLEFEMMTPGGVESRTVNIPEGATPGNDLQMQLGGGRKSKRKTRKKKKRKSKHKKKRKTQKRK